MKQQKILFITALLILTTHFSYGQQLIKVWESQARLQVPESVLYDSDSGNIFVSNIQGSPMKKDGNGFISMLDNNGHIKTLKWVTGLNAPKGMAIFDGKLYVADIDKLVGIDIEKAKIIEEYPVKNAVFLNDVTACKNGMVFVSDSRTGKIYLFENHKISEFPLDPVNGINGLCAANGKLYIGSNNIYELDIQTKEMNVLFEDTGGIDGIKRMEDGNFVFSHWTGGIFITKENQIIKLLDTSAEGINSADIDYIKESRLILVPTFNDNRVVAYMLTQEK